MTTTHIRSLPATAPFPEGAPSVPTQLGTADHQIRTHLLELSFPEFAQSVACLLSRLGYAEVQLMGVTQGRGRNAYGGFDLRATACHELSCSLLLAQVKQYRHPVPRSFVDELRGAMLRQGAQQGLLLTTSTFSPAAQEAAASAQHTLPIRLVEGEELARLLQEHGIPVGHKNRVTATKTRTDSAAVKAMSFPPPPLEDPPDLLVPEMPSPSVAGMTITLMVELPETSMEENIRHQRR